MPNIDVTDLLTDTDIANQTVVITRALRKTVNGVTTDAPYVATTYGSITPASGAALQQFPEEQRLLAHIMVIVPVRLIPLSYTNAPDRILYNGQNYRVMTVQDYGEFGSGFYVGTCQLDDTALIQTA